MNTTPPPVHDLPPHRHARIRATLVRAASEPRPRRWMAPALSMATAIVALGLVMWFVPLGGGDGRAAGPATTSAAANPTANPTADESIARLVQVPPEDVPELVHGCMDSAKVEGNFELKLVFADAAGQLAVLYSGDKLVTCELGASAGEQIAGFTVLGGFQPPICVDSHGAHPVWGSNGQMGYQLVIGRVDPATTARVTLTEKDVTVDAVLVGDVYAARIVRPLDWWLTDDNPPPLVVNAYNAGGDLVGSAVPRYP
jgi:hypothetical protein